MILTVFGGASPLPGSKEYESARNLGTLAASAGWTIATGGYIGIMEAASRGAAEAGGHVIGVTCDEIESYRPTKANQWVKEERKFKTLHDRLGHLVEICDAAIAMPGGVGTLAEITILWNGLIIHSSAPRPIILVGTGWKTILEVFYNQQKEFLRPENMQLVGYADTEVEAFEMVKSHPSLQ